MEDEPLRPEELAPLARRASDGDANAFAAIVRVTQADVWRACAALVDRESADDLTQDTFLRAYRALPGFAANASVRTWLLSIARHVCIDEIRARGRRRRNTRLLPPTSGHTEPWGHVELLVLIESLSAERREAFVLTQIVGLGYAEAAEVCACPVGTIRSRVARARNDLVTRLRVDDSGEA